MKPWKEMIKDSIDTIDALDKDLKLTANEKRMIQTIIERHPMCITQYYFNLIDKNDPNDPIRRLAIPNADELNDHGTYDTSGEVTNTILQGFQHKYKTTALVLSTNVCFVYCRFCFRKRMVGYTNEEILRRLHETVEYIQSHSEVNNVLISGGDSLTLSNDVIRTYLEKLSAIDHLDFIRFGTRVPVVLPQRIYEDDDLLDLYKTFNEKKQIIIVTHFNHPKELTLEAKKGIEALKNSGCVIRNQTVLLKGVNDDATILSDLIRGLTRFGIQPYYVFQCRPVKYATGYQIPISTGMDIISQAKKTFNGISKGFRYIMSHPKGKIEIIGKTKDQMFFKFHQTKNLDDNEKMIIHPIDDQATWLDEKLNPISY